MITKHSEEVFSYISRFFLSMKGINIDALESGDESLFGTPVVRQRTYSDGETSQSSPQIPSPVARLRFESNSSKPKSVSIQLHTFSFAIGYA